MSLILEALRKSEAERRRGRMPDLHAELPPAPVRLADATPWRWRSALAAAALLGLAAWLAASGLRPHDTMVVATRATPATATPPALPRVPHLQAMPRQKRPPEHAKPVPTPTAEAGDPMPAQPARVAAVAPEAQHRPVRDDAAAPPTETARPAMQAASPAPLPPPPVRSADVAPMQLSDLAPDARKALPPLRLSMHLWNDDPARRFVILDGERLAEGDRIGNLVVTRIVRDGVVLDWNGRVLKVPLR